MRDSREYKCLKEFYAKKCDKENIFYSFFTEGMLFWVKKMLSYIPDSVNLVLIGAGLDAEEKKWVHDTDREYIFLENHVDDTFIWNILFEINEYNFGWIDVDCFVFDSCILEKCTMFQDDKIFANAVWSWKSDLGLKYYNTYLIFISISVLQEIRKVISVYPNKYIYSKDDCGDPNLSVISDEHIHLLNDFIPIGCYPCNLLTGNRLPYFDTLTFYETIAQKLGYKGRKIAPLRSDIIQMYFSNQILHIGDASMFSDSNRESKFIGENYERYLEISYILLDQSARCLPKKYMHTLKYIKNELHNLGISENSVYKRSYKWLLLNGLCDREIRSLFS